MVGRPNFCGRNHKGNHMQQTADIITSLPAIPIEHLLALVALGAIGLAAWAIHAVRTLVRDREKE